jgi:hypothetical protein
MLTEKPNSLNRSNEGGRKNEKEHDDSCFLFIDGMDAFSIGWVDGLKKVKSKTE